MAAPIGCGAPAADPPAAEAGPAADLAELLPFLAPGARPNLRAAAAQHVLALTGSAAGRALLAGQAAVLRALVQLAAAPASDPDPASSPARDALRALVNLAADADLHRPLLEAEPGLLDRLLGRALEPRAPWAEEAAAVLANLSREPAPCGELLRALAVQSGLERLVRAICTPKGPKDDARAPSNYLGPLLANLSQQTEARAFLLDPARCRERGAPGRGWARVASGPCGLGL